MGASVSTCPLLQTHHIIVLSDMASKVLFATLLAVSHGAPAAPAPYAPAEAAYPDIRPSYNYQFGVNDPEYSGAVFSHQENREDYNTQGEYRVNLPDGRVQIVSYTAGPEGYVADVRYEGEAAYPEAAPYKPAPAPYKPAPAPYVPAPAPVVKVAPAPVVKVAPAPVVVKAAPVYAPAPAYHKPAPVYHKPAPVYHSAPVHHKPAPVYHHAPAYHAAPVYHKAHSYAPKKYGYSVVTTAAPAPAEEPEAKEAPAIEVAAEVEPAATEAAPAEESRYRYYRPSLSYLVKPQVH